MRLLIQRVSRASVEIEGTVKGAIEKGFLVLVGVTHEDTEEDLEYLAQKLLKIRLFDDENGVMNLDVGQVGGELLVVSQFTLHAMTKKGNRPSWIKAAPEAVSRPMYERFVDAMQSAIGRRVATGSFGADMKIELINDGPVTIWMDSRQRE